MLKGRSPCARPTARAENLRQPATLTRSSRTPSPSAAQRIRFDRVRALMALGFVPSFWEVSYAIALEIAAARLRAGDRVTPVDGRRAVESERRSHRQMALH